MIYHSNEAKANVLIAKAKALGVIMLDDTFADQDGHVTELYILITGEKPVDGPMHETYYLLSEVEQRLKEIEHDTAR